MIGPLFNTGEGYIGATVLLTSIDFRNVMYVPLFQNNGVVYI